MFHVRNKHIEVHYHVIQERVLAGNVDLQTIGIFTKALGADKLR